VRLLLAVEQLLADQPVIESAGTAGVGVGAPRAVARQEQRGDLRPVPLAVAVDPAVTLFDPDQ
jgi:hypothetical protein